MSTPTPTPTQEELEDLILSSRYGELEELESFKSKYGTRWFTEARDENGNTCLHMCCANGHDDILSFLLPILSPTATSLTPQNKNLSTPLHWASINGHITTIRLLSPHLPQSAYEMRNSAGLIPLVEAENRAGESGGEKEGEGVEGNRWSVCARFLVEVMNVERGDGGNAKDGDGEVDERKEDAGTNGLEDGVKGVSIDS